MIQSTIQWTHIAIQLVIISTNPNITEDITENGMSHIMRNGTSHIMRNGMSHTTETGMSPITVGGANHITVGGTSHITVSGMNHPTMVNTKTITKVITITSHTPIILGNTTMTTAMAHMMPTITMNHQRSSTNRSMRHITSLTE